MRPKEDCGNIKSVGRGLRLIVLSNFAGGKASALLIDRCKAYDAKGQAYRQSLQHLESAHKKALSTFRDAILGFRLIEAWRMWWESERVDDEIRRVSRHAPMWQAASIEEQQARTGDEAEKLLDEYLTTCLDARWTLISGYMGRGGEVDRILIGPWGVFAFEVKGNRGVVCSDGIRWWMEKRNRSGNLIGAKQLARSPDAQLNKAVKWLAGWLVRNKSELPITRVVLFTAPDARIGSIYDVDADFVTTLMDMDIGYLFDPLAKGGALAPDTCERIINLIRRDHAFWERKRLGEQDGVREISAVNTPQVSRISCSAH